MKIIVFHLAILFYPVFVTGDIKCSLKWAPNAFGHLPNDAISFWNTTTGNNNVMIIGRVMVIDNWSIGVIYPSKGKLVTFLNNRYMEFDFYQVLTNPNNCQLNWVDICNNNKFPLNAIENGSLQDSKSAQMEYVGRAIYQGYQISGKIFNNKLYAPFPKAKSIITINKENCYQILTSIYPKLSVDFKSIEYTLNHLNINTATTTEIINGHVINNTLNDVQLNTTITHEKEIVDEFVFYENAAFDEIDSISLRFGLWFGSEDLNLRSYKLNGMKQLSIIRNRTITLSSQISVTKQTQMQVCSLMAVINNNFPIPFEAIGIFTLPNMTGNHVEYVLSTIGSREILEISTTNVKAKIKGYLKGSYVTSETMYTGNVNKLGTCSSFM